MCQRKDIVAGCGGSVLQAVCDSLNEKYLLPHRLTYLNTCPMMVVLDVTFRKCRIIASLEKLHHWGCALKAYSLVSSWTTLNMLNFIGEFRVLSHSCLTLSLLHVCG